jgi:T-complex protein 1 subunit theta
MKLIRCLLADESLTCFKVADLHNREEAIKAIRPAIASKQAGYEDFLAGLIVDASQKALGKDGSFNVDNVRMIKLPGAGVLSSKVIHGMVFNREVESAVNSIKNAKVRIHAWSPSTLVLRSLSLTLAVPRPGGSLLFGSRYQFH